jgi:hypothetical protein
MDVQRRLLRGLETVCILGIAVQLHSSIKQKTCQRKCANLDDWLTVHRTITLVNFQHDAKKSLFIYNTFIKILYMFRAVGCSSSGGLIVSMQNLVSSLCKLHYINIKPMKVLHTAVILLTY